jgi:M6 family metalloprotease-like protein
MMPKGFGSYGNMLGFLGADIWVRRAKLVNDVIKSVDEQVDFSKYDVAVIVVPNVSLISYAYRGTISTNDGSAVTLATVQREDRPEGIVIHEIGHMLGLRDLYDYALADKLGSSDAAAIYVGPWCLMSTGFRGCMHFCAYNKIKLGWVQPEGIKVVSPSSSECVTVKPLEIKTEGIQVIKIPITEQSYYLVEVRRKIGFDGILPDEGMLITFVDETISGGGFIKVKDAKPGTADLYDATFDVAPGKQNAFIDQDHNLAVTVVQAKDSEYTICVTTPSTLNRPGALEEIVRSSNLPKLLGPANDTLGVPIRGVSFSWANFKDSMEYELQLAKDAEMTEIVGQVNVTGTAYRWEKDLNPSTIHYWRVRATKPELSQWSSPFSFVTENVPPPPPTTTPPSKFILGDLSCEQKSSHQGSGPVGLVLMLAMVGIMRFVTWNRTKR